MESAASVPEHGCTCMYTVRGTMVILVGWAPQLQMPQNDSQSSSFTTNLSFV